ncbi:MAG: DUF4405 domain-containing protein [Pirellulales bacterium]
MLSRTAVNFLLDAALLAVFVLLIAASAIVRFVFPPGTTAAGWRLWGLGFDEWGALQFALVALLALGVLVHVMLHWSWVCGVVANRVAKRKGKVDDGLQTIYGVGLLIVICNVVGLLLAAAALSVREPSTDRRAQTEPLQRPAAAQAGHTPSPAGAARA